MVTIVYRRVNDALETRPALIPQNIVDSSSALRSATKWVLSSYAGVAALVVTGLGLAQVTGVAANTAGPGATFGAFLLCLAAIGCVLQSAANVLTVRFVTIRAFLAYEEATLRMDRGFRRCWRGRVIARLKAGVEKERDLLYARTGAADLSELYQQGREEGDDAIAALDAAVSVIAYVDYLRTNGAFRRLLIILVATTAILGTALAYVASSAASSTGQIEYSQPTAVRLYLTPLGTRLLTSPSECPNGPPRDLIATVIDGKASAPSILVAPSSRCRSFTIRLETSMGVAVPLTSGK